MHPKHGSLQEVFICLRIGVSKNNGTPKSSILIGFSLIFTIHFGVFPPIFGNTPMVVFRLRPTEVSRWDHLVDAIASSPTRMTTYMFRCWKSLQIRICHYYWVGGRSKICISKTETPDGCWLWRFDETFRDLCIHLHPFHSSSS